MGEIAGEYEVVVVGGGIMGSCIAYHIAKRGRTVLLLEQYDFLHHRGSSHGESRTIRDTYPEEYYTAMMKEAFQLWEEAQEEIGYRVHIPTPHLDMGSPQNKSLQSVIRVCKSQGVPHQILGAEEAAGRFELPTLPHHWIALLTPRGGILRASKAVAMFQSLALKNGAVLRDNARVVQISHGWKLSDGSREGVLVCTHRGSALARRCVVSAGAWARKLARQISGIELPVQPLHATVAYWKIEDAASREFLPENGFPTFACYCDPYLYGTPSLEYPGLLKVSVHGGYPCDPDERSLVPDVESLKAKVSPWLARRFKGAVVWEAPAIAEACMYSMTPDEDFILDFLPLRGATEKSPVLVATGFSGHGFKMGPLVGRVMADLALEGEAGGVPLQYFCIQRFLRNPQGNVKDFGQQVSSSSFSSLTLRTAS